MPESRWQIHVAICVSLGFFTLPVISGHEMMIKIMDHGANVITRRGNEDPIGLFQGFCPTQAQSRTYQRHGGSLEVPVSESCLLDKECRRDVLTIASNAIENGVGGNVHWRKQSRGDKADKENDSRNITKR